MTLTVGVIGIDHRHIFGQLENMQSRGCICKGWYTDGEPQPIDGFIKRFHNIPRVPDQQTLLQDPEIDMILTAGIPSQRANVALAAMRAGKDVMTDKPGCTTLEQLAALRACGRDRPHLVNRFFRTFRGSRCHPRRRVDCQRCHWQVIQTVGLGPHRLNLPTRPDWFFDETAYGGILTDIASHQVDQFLYLTGSDDAEIVSSSVGNFANPDHPGLQDFGEILLRSDNASGYVRVDWYTPDALPNWGDGRLTVLGTEGYIELRKYVDVAGRDGTDHLFLVNRDRCEYIDASNAPLPYFERLISDVKHRTDTAMAQDHCFKVMELALRAQAQATRLRAANLA